MLEKITRAIFHPDDDELLNYLHDDGVSIEPDYYMPVIPMVLVNGSDGIGTGWSSKVPNYDPRQIISNIRKMIKGEPVVKMDPFYSGFSGKIKPEGDGKYSVHGIIEREDDETLLISELPVRGWTQDCKIALEKMIVSEKPGVTPEIKDFAENHTDTTVSFTITADKASIDKWEKLPKGGLYAKFKLISSTSTTNMHLYDNERKIVKYEQPENILESFFGTRMEFYVKRKALLVKKLHQEQKMLSNKARFVDEVCNRTLVVSNRKKTELLKELQSSGYDLFDKTNNGSNHDSDDDEDEEDSTSTSDLSKGYDYLLGMRIMALTYEKAELLRKQLAERTAELEKLEAKTPSEIWCEDLDAIEVALKERDEEILQAEVNEVNAQKKTAKRQKAKTAATKKKTQKKKKKDDWDSDDEDEDEEMVVVVKKKPAPRARKPAAAKKAPAPKKIINVDDDDEAVVDVEMKEAEVVVRKKPAPKARKPAAKKASKPLKIIDVDVDDEAVDDDIKNLKKRPSPKAKAKKLPAKKKVAVAKKKTLEVESEEEADWDDESESESDSSDVEMAQASAPAPKRATRVRAKKATTYTFEEDDDDSFMAESDSDDEDF